MAERMSGPGTGPGRAPYHTTVEARLDEATAAVRNFVAQRPRVGVVLGSGLGRFAERLAGAQQVPYSRIPHMPDPSVPGHAGCLWFGSVAGVPVACLQGRVHLYEGHEPDAVVFGCRLLARLGCRSVLLTNAAGGIRQGLFPGTLMLIVDHLNLTGENPLTGIPGSFVDLSNAYDPELGASARAAAKELSLSLDEGVYASLRGPSYETPAEIRMLRTLGADAVGMSTVLETIALRRMGVSVGAVSCITNFAAGISSAELTHDEVTVVARRVESSLGDLMTRWIELADQRNQAGR